MPEFWSMPSGTWSDPLIRSTYVYLSSRSIHSSSTDSLIDSFIRELGNDPPMNDASVMTTSRYSFKAVPRLPYRPRRFEQAQFSILATTASLLLKLPSWMASVDVTHQTRPRYLMVCDRVSQSFFSLYHSLCLINKKLNALIGSSNMMQILQQILSQAQPVISFNQSWQ